MVIRIRVFPATALLLLLAAAPAQAGDRAGLVDGVAEIAAPGVPGPLCVFGPDAFAVAAGGIGRGLQAPVVAAARWGKGRVVVFGHGGYFGKAALETGDTGRLLANAVRWAGKGRGRIRVIVDAAPALALRLRAAGFDVLPRDERGPFGPADVLCVDTHRLDAAERVAAVRGFVESGGGLVTAGLGWGWKQLHPGRDLASDHPGNRLLADSGIVFADGYLKRTTRDGYAVRPTLSEALHAGSALHTLRSGKARNPQQAGWSVVQAARALPATDRLLRPALSRLAHRFAGKVRFPLGPKKTLERVAVAIEVETWRRAPAARARAHPAARAFPGAVPRSAHRVVREVTVDPRVPGWHSTGLYAVPGGPVTVTLPREAAGRGLRLRIGAHSDALWQKATWKRAPEITTLTELAASSTQAANPFGGPVYLEVSRPAPAVPFTARIGGAIEAPRFVLGVTSRDDWRRTVRGRPAPWAELETRKVVLTVPSNLVRGLDDPEPLMRFWDRVLDAAADLAQRPRERTRPERYVADVQISAGYMHSGYPIMTHLDAAARMVDLERMRSGDWGLFHELGHNHQRPEWTFAGTGEVTCNLFTLYVYDKVCGIPPTGHERLTGQARERMLREYREGGRDFGWWKQRPFLALIMYAQLQEAFGWEPFERVFAGYRDLPADERPRDDAAKRDEWMVRMSRAVGRDLGPFFAWWNVPVSPEARARVAELPDWMPGR